MSEVKIGSSVAESIPTSSTDLAASSVDAQTAENFSQSVTGSKDDFASNYESVSSLFEAKAKESDLQKSIVKIKTEIDDPELPAPMKSALRATLQVCYAKLDDLYEQYPSLNEKAEVVDKIRQN